MNSFVGAINDMEKHGQSLDPVDRELYVTMLVEAATDIDRDSHLLFLTSKGYSEVSGKYMINQIAGITFFLSLQTDLQRTIALKDVVGNTTINSLEVQKLTAERQRQYQMANDARQQEYQTFLDQVMIHEITDPFQNFGIGRK